MSHRNVLKLFEKIEVQKENRGYNLYLMELCQGGDLLSYLRKRHHIDENLAKYFFR
jgi:serine/threonine protein kinase